MKYTKENLWLLEIKVMKFNELKNKLKKFHVCLVNTIKLQYGIIPMMEDTKLIKIIHDLAVSEIRLNQLLELEIYPDIESQLLNIEQIKQRLI